MDGDRNERRSRHLLGLRRFLRIIPALVEVSQTILERVALTTRLSFEHRGFIGISGVHYSSDSALLVFFYFLLCRAYIYILFFPLLVILGRLTSQTRHVGDTCLMPYHIYPRRSWMVSGC